MVDAQESSQKFLSKNRWRNKIFSNEEAVSKKQHQQAPEPRVNRDDDVNDFLRPSTEKANAQKQAAAAAFLSGAKPRIDVARAQRWPAANELVNSAGGRSPGIGGLSTGKKRPGIAVNFARTQPEIIGEGGDECEEPAIEVSRRKQSLNPLSMAEAQVQTHHDDMNVGTSTFSGSSNKEAERRGIVTRTLTSHGELSPPLQRKMEMGSINTHATPPPLPERGLGQMGLGERPRALQRAPTGFDNGQGDGIPRSSLDSPMTNESGNASPALSKKAFNMAPTQEEDDFVPKPLKRTPTGWSEHDVDSDDEAPPPIPLMRSMPHMPPIPSAYAPRLPDMNLNTAASPLDSSLKPFLESEPTDPDSYSARVIHKMRADEGRALHEAAHRKTVQEPTRDSPSSPDSIGPHRVPQVGTPPSQFVLPLAGKTPPRLQQQREPPPQSLDPDYDPYRAKSLRQPSPGRRPMPPETFPLDTNPRPSSSSSSQYTIPSAASRARASPTRPADRFPASPLGSDPMSAISQRSVVPTPGGYEAPEHKETTLRLPPAPPLYAQSPTFPTTPPRRETVKENYRQEQGAATSLGRSDTKSQGEIAFADFSQRVQHMKGIFMLTAQLAGHLYDHTPMQWLRVATWWFLRGRAGMEHLIRSRPRDGEPQPERLTQPHVDLAKAWWIITEIIPEHPSLPRYGNDDMASQANFSREAGDVVSAEAYELHDIILSTLKSLLGSMKRHSSMPPTQALIQGQDQSIWVEYPRFAPDAHSVLAGTASKSVLSNSSGQTQFNPALLMPVGDTNTDFCYYRMFVTISMSTDDHNTDRVPLPAVISVLRSRDDYKVKLSICSQTELVNVMVGPDPDVGPTWRDVAWKSKTRGMNIQLRHGFNLTVELTEQDFRGLWSIVDHTNRVESSLRQKGDERLSARFNLRDFAYRDPSNPAAFPPERVRGCKLVTFQRFELSNEGTGRRRLHRGYRLVVVTGTKTRTLSCVTHEMGTNQEPTDFEYTVNPEDNAPGLILRFKGETPDKKPKTCKMSMFFNDPKERNILFGTFTSMNQAEDEAVFAQVPLKAFSIESADQAEGFSQSGHDVLKRLQWIEAKILNQDPELAGLEAAPTVLSESLRIVCRHSAGVISDRMNLGPGDLLVRLPIDGAPELTLLRNPQHDMAIAIDSSHTDKDVPAALGELLQTLTNASTIRKLTFENFKDLHAFQLAVTGFKVLFDGIASSLFISRRRAVVPIYKQWTANTIRLQVVAQDNVVQLLAFFEEFSHADAMNFQLKSMDTFEKTDKGGKPCLKLVDAKFALPVEERRGEGKMGKAEGKISGWAGMKRKFVCLDQIEYPGEHDDILIAFDSEKVRDLFAEALPATAQVGRKFTVRRKI